MRIGIEGERTDPNSSAIIEDMGNMPEPPAQQIQLPFVSRKEQNVELNLRNEASNPSNPIVRVGVARLYELGPARFLWTRYPRFVIHAVQRIFITAVMLPLAIFGLLIVIFKKQSAALIVLSVVPIYFFMVQSIVHTEYRYVLAVDYFLFAFAGVAISSIISFAVAKIRSFRAAPARSTH